MKWPFAPTAASPWSFNPSFARPVTTANFEIELPAKSRVVVIVVGAIFGLGAFGCILYFVGKGSAEPQIVTVPVN